MYLLPGWADGQATHVELSASQRTKPATCSSNVLLIAANCLIHPSASGLSSLRVSLKNSRYRFVYNKPPSTGKYTVIVSFAPNDGDHLGNKVTKSLKVTR